MLGAPGPPGKTVSANAVLVCYLLVMLSELSRLLVRNLAEGQVNVNTRSTCHVLEREVSSLPGMDK